MIRPLVALLVAVSAMPLSAETRTWKSADGKFTRVAEFISRDADHVTIRDANGRQASVEISKLNLEDQKWLDEYHSLSAPSPQSEPDPRALFDTLKFNDSRETVLAKLKASKFAEMTMDETFIGRSGLNGVFRTRQKIGDLNASLYFDWTDGGKLQEINLQTDALPAEGYETAIAPSWKKSIELLSELYGKPMQKGPLPASNSINSGSFNPSHLWNLDGGSVLLGTAREGPRYQLVVRFTQKKIQPIALP